LGEGFYKTFRDNGGGGVVAKETVGLFGTTDGLQYPEVLSRTNMLGGARGGIWTAKLSGCRTS